MKTIKRNLALLEMSIRELPDGKKNIFSIKFCDKKGILRFFPYAISSGAGRMDNKEHRVRGVRPCSPSGIPQGHVYPVGIDRIQAFNQMKVIL